MAKRFAQFIGKTTMHVQGWSAETKKIMPVGQGSMDWKKIFAAAKTGVIKKLFCGNEPGNNESQRSSPSKSVGLMWAWLDVALCHVRRELPYCKRFDIMIYLCHFIRGVT